MYPLTRIILGNNSLARLYLLQFLVLPLEWLQLISHPLVYGIYMTAIRKKLFNFQLVPLHLHQEVFPKLTQHFSSAQVIQYFHWIGITYAWQLMAFVCMCAHLHMCTSTGAIVQAFSTGKYQRVNYSLLIICMYMCTTCRYGVCVINR